MLPSAPRASRSSTICVARAIATASRSPPPFSPSPTNSPPPPASSCANQDDWGAFGFAHEEAGGGGEFVGDGENGGGGRVAVAIARAPQIVEDRSEGRRVGEECR